MSILVLHFLLEIAFLSIVFLHITKKNVGAILAYGIQSLVIVFLLFNSYLESAHLELLLVVILALIVKVILVPTFLIRLIQKHELTFSISTYLNTPLTFIVLVFLIFIAYSNKFLPLTNIVPAHNEFLMLALAMIFISLFLIVNRRGVISQIIGILSLENSIVAFAVFAGLEQSPVLQIGILFNIFIWSAIAMVFVSMIYKHFGSLDTQSMENLKD
jgi:hydrogenase-4 component E